MSKFEFAVPTLFGLEGIAGDELRRLDLENVRVENGRVLFSGDESAMARANVNLRTGERVLLVLADFQAKTFEELFQGVYNAPLEAVIPKNGAYASSQAKKTGMVGCTCLDVIVILPLFRSVLIYGFIVPVTFIKIKGISYFPFYSFVLRFSCAANSNSPFWRIPSPY